MNKVIISCVEKIEIDRATENVGIKKPCNQWMEQGKIDFKIRYFFLLFPTHKSVHYKMHLEFTAPCLLSVARRDR